MRTKDCEYSYVPAKHYAEFSHDPISSLRTSVAEVQRRLGIGLIHLIHNLMQAPRKVAINEVNLLPL